nr:RNA-directed DNA polymerase, eukaryota [Tanacetum cinerariifolium]
QGKLLFFQPLTQKGDQNPVIQRSSKQQKENNSSEDEQQDTRKGRSKRERWTSHKEKDFSLGIKASTSVDIKRFQLPAHRKLAAFNTRVDLDLIFDLASVKTNMKMILKTDVALLETYFVVLSLALPSVPRSMVHKVNTFPLDNILAYFTTLVTLGNKLAWKGPPFDYTYLGVTERMSLLRRSFWYEERLKALPKGGADLCKKFNAKELWNTCKQYGFVVDAFIPTRRSKAGKRFGFVRFINVFDAERLVNNLCTIWIRRYKIYANIARFQRAPMNNSISQFKNNEAKRNYTYTDAKGHANSYVHTVKGFQKPNLGNESNPILVLDDSCLNQQDYSYCLLGKVMFEFTIEEVKKKFQSCTTISSWFSQIQQATCDFTTNRRVSWVEIEALQLNLSSQNHLELLIKEDSNVEAVPDTMFEEVLPNANGGDAPSVRNKEMHSEDPCNIYDLLKVKKVPSADSLKYPPGFTPNDDIEDGEVHLAQKAKKDWVKELCMKNKVNFLSLQETKMEKIELFDIKRCWGNFAFEYVHSDSVGNLGGILCIWDTNSFFKHNATVSNYFVALRGIWVPNGKHMLIISVYAPQELTEKKMLWDYLSLVITNWKGEVIIMGDFNEVRNKTKRFGLVFNAQGANAFNTFISSSGLAKVPFGGCSFTWCHKSTTKMSKLDRYLISESLMSSCPNISAISLDRLLSDHRSKLLLQDIISIFDGSVTTKAKVQDDLLLLWLQRSKPEEIVDLVDTA